MNKERDDLLEAVASRFRIPKVVKKLEAFRKARGEGAAKEEGKYRPWSREYRVKPAAKPRQEGDLNKCPGCGGEADNGFDRELPPNPYYCTKCEPEGKDG